MAAKKLSPAQQTLVAAITGKTLTYRIARNVGGVSRSIFEAKIDGKKPDFRIALATIEALINSGHAVLKSVRSHIYGDIHTVVLPCDNQATVPTAVAEVKAAPEAEAQEAPKAPEAQEAEEAPEVEAPAPEVSGTETKVWPEKREMSKYGYAVMQVKDCIAGYTYYVVTDYKPAALVGSCSPGIVCRASIPEEAIAAAKALERGDMSLSRAWRACKIRMARKGLRKSKGLQTNAPTTPAPAPEATEAKAATAESTEVEAHEVEATEAHMGDSVQAAEYLKQARVLADEREISMGRCISFPTHKRHIGE